MALDAGDWIKLMDEEYLSGFVVKGGAAVKFAVTEESNIPKLVTALKYMATAHKMAFVDIDSANVKLHMMQDIFFAIARGLDWERDAQKFVESLFLRNGYRWPAPGEPVVLTEVADANDVDPTILRREINGWLTREVMRDPHMAQDFRIAMTQLCQNRLAPVTHDANVVAPIIEWLRGELQQLSPLKRAQIYTKINRYNSRAMLRSLCHWLFLSGHSGLFVTIDIRQLTRSSSMPPDGRLRYTSGAIMDAYEVFRQLVDDTSIFERFFLTVVADKAFIGDDPKRSVDAYTALKMRIWDDVRARTRDNPLAPMVVLNPI